MGIEIQMNGTPRQTDNRRARRYRYRGEAVIRRLGLDPSTAGSTLDLSTRGCLLKLPDLTNLEVDAPIEVNIYSNVVSFRALGTVRHRSPSRSLVGIAFVNLSRRGESDLYELLAELALAQQSAPTVLEFCLP